MLYYLSSSECLKQLIKISEVQSCLAPGEFSAFLLTRTLSILQGWIQSRLPIVPAESDLPLLHRGHSASPRASRGRRALQWLGLVNFYPEP